MVCVKAALGVQHDVHLADAKKGLGRGNLCGDEIGVAVDAVTIGQVDRCRTGCQGRQAGPLNGCPCRRVGRHAVDGRGACCSRKAAQSKGTHHPICMMLISTENRLSVDTTVPTLPGPPGNFQDLLLHGASRPDSCPEWRKTKKKSDLSVLCVSYHEIDIVE
mmetsp:Transcript_16918/g.34658  ORF Transcript_16918/g.34658 Transcript_16918/m.34658 type:complete len:162 (+) Transcript_16918:407-892(+)